MRCAFRKIILAIIALPLPGAICAVASQNSASADTDHMAVRVLHANSATIDVRDGNRLLKGVWNADPSVPLDVYPAWRSSNPKTVMFVSDIDSISFDVEPGKTYDFTILLNGKGVCHTRILAQADSATRLAGGAGPTTIPFTIRKGKIHIVGSFNDSPPLDLIFDTGASSAVLYPSGVKKGVKVAFDGAVLNPGTGGTTLRRTSSNNLLTVGDLQWKHSSILYIERQADAADGIVGFDVFEDKLLELDYDRKVMVIHDALPQYSASYSAVPITYLGVLPLVAGAFTSGSLRTASPLVIDTGGDGTLIADNDLLAANGLLSTLKIVGSHRAGGVGYGTIPVKEMIAPEFQLAGYSLKNVPVDVRADSSNPPGGALFLNVLSRFNTILDYQNNMAYFRPNSHFNDPYPSHGPSSAILFIGCSILVSALAGTAMYRVKKKPSMRN